LEDLVSEAEKFDPNDLAVIDQETLKMETEKARSFLTDPEERFLKDEEE
jgi:hypothetical protein